MEHSGVRIAKSKKLCLADHDQNYHILSVRHPMVIVRRKCARIRKLLATQHGNLLMALAMTGSLSLARLAEKTSCPLFEAEINTESVDIATTTVTE